MAEDHSKKIKEDTMKSVPKPPYVGRNPSGNPQDLNADTFTDEALDPENLEAENLGKVLRRIAGQIDNADRSNSDTLQEMQRRLKSLYQHAAQVKNHTSRNDLTGAKEAIDAVENHISNLTDRIEIISKGHAIDHSRSTLEDRIEDLAEKVNTAERSAQTSAQIQEKTGEDISDTSAGSKTDQRLEKTSDDVYEDEADITFAVTEDVEMNFDFNYWDAQNEERINRHDEASQLRDNAHKPTGRSDSKINEPEDEPEDKPELSEEYKALQKELKSEQKLLRKKREVQALEASSKEKENVEAFDEKIAEQQSFQAQAQPQKVATVRVTPQAMPSQMAPEQLQSLALHFSPVVDKKISYANAEQEQTKDIRTESQKKTKRKSQRSQKQIASTGFEKTQEFTKNHSEKSATSHKTIYNLEDRFTVIATKLEETLDKRAQDIEERAELTSKFDQISNKLEDLLVKKQDKAGFQVIEEKLETLTSFVANAEEQKQRLDLIETNLVKLLDLVEKNHTKPALTAEDLNKATQKILDNQAKTMTDTIVDRISDALVENTKTHTQNQTHLENLNATVTQLTAQHNRVGDQQGHDIEGVHRDLHRISNQIDDLMHELQYERRRDDALISKKKIKSQVDADHEGTTLREDPDELLNSESYFSHQVSSHIKAIENETDAHESDVLGEETLDALPQSLPPCDHDTGLDDPEDASLINDMRLHHDDSNHTIEVSSKEELIEAAQNAATLASQHNATPHAGHTRQRQYNSAYHQDTLTQAAPHLSNRKNILEVGKKQALILFFTTIAVLSSALIFFYEVSNTEFIAQKKDDSSVSLETFKNTQTFRDKAFASLQTQNGSRERDAAPQSRQNNVPQSASFDDRKSEYAAVEKGKALTVTASPENGSQVREGVGANSIGQTSNPNRLLEPVKPVATSVTYLRSSSQSLEQTQKKTDHSSKARSYSVDVKKDASPSDRPTQSNTGQSLTHHAKIINKAKVSPLEVRTQKIHTTSGAASPLNVQMSDRSGHSDRSAHSVKTLSAKTEAGDLSDAFIKLPKKKTLELRSKGAAKSAAFLPAKIGPHSLRMAAVNGDSAAQFKVAMRFIKGKGVRKDFKSATTWLKRSASQGYASAQFHLATLYERGTGLSKDIRKAQNWYRRSALQGHLKAMHNLGVIHTTHSHNLIDYSVAAKWFLKAAQHGLTDSQYNLALLYQNGMGVQKNNVEALKWFMIAARNGDVHAVQQATSLKESMSAREVELSEKAAGTWKKL